MTAVEPRPAPGDHALASATSVFDVFATHRHALLVTVRSLVGSTDTAEDIVQEVFEIYWKAPDRFDPERGSLRSYLRGIARHRAIDSLRRRDAQVRRDERWRAPSDPAAAEDIALANVAAADLRSRVARLPAINRRPIEIAYFSEVSYRQVALMLGVPEGTIKTRIREGLRLLALDCRRTGVSDAQPNAALRNANGPIPVSKLPSTIDAANR